MSETTSEQTEPQEQQQGDPAEAPLGEGGKKALEAERKARQEAEKAAAALQKQLDDLNAASMSDLERAQKAAQQAQEAATRATADAAKFRTAAKYGITDDRADLFLTASDPETLERQAAELVAMTSHGPKPDPSQGAKGSTGSRTTADQFADFVRDTI